MSEQSQKSYRFHRRVGFNGKDGIQFVDKGDYIDLPEEVVKSPYFAAVMKEGYVEQLGTVAPAPGQDVLEQVRAEAEEAKAAAEAAKADAAKAQAEAEAARAELAKAEKALKTLSAENAKLKKAQ